MDYVSLYCILGITIFKIFTWGRISSDIRSKINILGHGAVKPDFPHIYPTIYLPNENFEYDYPLSNALLRFCFKFERCKQQNVVRHPTICDIIDDVKLFHTVYRRIYCRKFMTLGIQVSRYKIKCIRIKFS